MPAGSLDYPSWGTAVTTDFDNDGIADVIVNGKYYLKVLRGTGGGNFTAMNTLWGIKDIAASAVDDGLRFGDFDGDGDLDIIGYDEIWLRGTLNVYRNHLPARSGLNVRPVGLAGNVGAAGARIRVFAAGTTELLWSDQVAQTVRLPAGDELLQHERDRAPLRPGEPGAVDVVVEFASGRVTRINNVTANQTMRVLESAGN